MLALRLNPKLNRDDGPPGPEWSVCWFAIEGIGAPRFLDRDLTLIDAGD